MTRDLVCSAVLLGLGAGYYLLAAGIGRSALSDEVGPGGLPILYAAILAFLAVAQALTTILRSKLSGVSRPGGRSYKGGASSNKAGGQDKDAQPLTAVLRRAAGVLAIGVGYLLLVPYTGYVLALILVISSTAIYFGERSPGRALLISIAGAGVFWLLFVQLMGIPMPTFWSS